jgi:hypothetical protein
MLHPCPVRLSLRVDPHQAVSPGSGYRDRRRIVGSWKSGDSPITKKPGVNPSDPGNAERVWSAVARFGAPLKSLGVTAEDFGRPDQVVQVGLPPRRIDILTSISGVTFDEAWPDRVTHETEGLAVPFLGRAALVRNKRASGRAKDLADLEALGESD